MTDVVSAIASLLGVVAEPIADAILAELRPETAAQVRARIAPLRARLEANAGPDVEPIIARHMSQALPPPSRRITKAHVATLRALAASTSGALLNPVDREALLLVAADIDLRVADTLPAPMPAVLDVPTGPWSQPGHEED